MLCITQASKKMYLKCRLLASRAAAMSEISICEPVSLAFPWPLSMPNENCIPPDEAVTALWGVISVEGSQLLACEPNTRPYSGAGQCSAAQFNTLRRVSGSQASWLDSKV